MNKHSKISQGYHSLKHICVWVHTSKAYAKTLPDYVSRRCDYTILVDSLSRDLIHFVDWINSPYQELPADKRYTCFY
jgi:hypothetical protein